MRLRPASLRWRMTLAFGVLGCVLSLLFASATIFITEHYEEVMVEGMLNGLAQDMRERHARNPDQELSLPRSRLLQGYLRHSDGTSDVPAIFSTLPLGMQEPEMGEGKDVYVGVSDLAGDRLFIVIDMHEVEQLEIYLERVLAGIVVAGTGIAGWLGWLLAGRAIAPVRLLAESVESLPVQARPTHLAESIADDELGRLAMAIDGYQARLVQSEDRERKFFADASHELRTPLSVVRGATELLLEDRQLADASRERLRRLDRGVLTLTDLLDVMLRRARAISSPLETVDTEAWLRETLAGLDEGGEVSLHVEQPTLMLRPREARLVVRGLIRHLGRSEERRKLDVTVVANTITLRHARDASLRSGKVGIESSADAPVGTTLTGSLADRMEWTVDESQVDAGCITISLPSAQT